jgi:hypothetical protein
MFPGGEVDVVSFHSLKKLLKELLLLICTRWDIVKLDSFFIVTWLRATVVDLWAKAVVGSGEIGMAPRSSGGWKLGPFMMMKLRLGLILEVKICSWVFKQSWWRALLLGLNYQY